MIGFSPVNDSHAQSEQWIISNSREFDIYDVHVYAKFLRATYYPGYLVVDLA